MVQIHKEFTDSQVKELIERYLKNEIERKYIQEVLGIGKTRFFALKKEYRKNPNEFSIKYTRKTKTIKISQSIEHNIIKELQIEKGMIQDKDIPLRYYNYSYIKNLLDERYNQKVSLSTIIDRAKKNDLYLKKRPRKDPHDREVLTNYIGEIIQHDSSYHLWSPPAKEKWLLTPDVNSGYQISSCCLFPLIELPHIGNRG